MQIQDINLGFKGRFQVTVKKEDGSIKTELPWQDNLITNEGIKLLNGINQVTNLNGVSDIRYIHINCFVGSSSTQPAVTDTKLGNYISAIFTLFKPVKIYFCCQYSLTWLGLDSVGSSISVLKFSPLVFTAI